MAKAHIRGQAGSGGAVAHAFASATMRASSDYQSQSASKLRHRRRGRGRLRLRAVVRDPRWRAARSMLVDRTRKRTEAVATDLRYGTPLNAKSHDRGRRLRATLPAPAIVMITAGVNEKTGGATPTAAIRRAGSGCSTRTPRSTATSSRASCARPPASRAARRQPIRPIRSPTSRARCAGHDTRELSTGTLLDGQRFPRAPRAPLRRRRRDRRGRR